MENFTATYLASHMGEVIDEAMAAPVLINRHSRPAVVLINWREYERLTSAAGEPKRVQEDKGS